MNDDADIALSLTVLLMIAAELCYQVPCQFRAGLAEAHGCGRP